MKPAPLLAFGPFLYGRHPRLARSLGLLLALGAWAWPQAASACLSCGCAGAVPSAEGEAGAGLASFRAQDRRWWWQASLGGRVVSGAATEAGQWSPMPVGGSLASLGGQAALWFLPRPGWALGVKAPWLLNRAEAASWGPFGQIAPTDAGPAWGGGLGDLGLMAQAPLGEASWGELLGAAACWGGASWPSGRAEGGPEGLTGAGVPYGQAGLGAHLVQGGWSCSLQLGRQQALGTALASGAVAFLGDAWLTKAELEGPWPGLPCRWGVGLEGAWGELRAAQASVATARWRVQPSLSLPWGPDQSWRLALAWDLPGLARSTPTDLSWSLGMSQYWRGW